MNKSVPLSQGLAKLRSNQSASQPLANVSEDRLREILAEVIDQRVSEKIVRLETSINRMIDHFEAVRRGEAEDSALRVTTDMSAVVPRNTLFGFILTFGEKGRERPGASDEAWVSGCANTGFTKRA